jgi:hypothetical protein
MGLSSKLRIKRRLGRATLFDAKPGCLRRSSA